MLIRKSLVKYQEAGTTNTLPIWSDGPNSVLNDSPITTIYDLGGNSKQVDIHNHIWFWREMEV